MKLTKEIIIQGLENLKKQKEVYFPPHLIFNKFEWLHNDLIKWTEEEIDNADKITGLIGTRGGVDCYLARLISF